MEDLTKGKKQRQKKTPRSPPPPRREAAPSSSVPGSEESRQGLGCHTQGVGSDEGDEVDGEIVKEYGRGWRPKRWKFVSRRRLERPGGGGVEG